MKTLSSNVVAEKKKLHQTNRWIWLVELAVSDTESFRIARYQTDVTVGSTEYKAFPFAITPVKQSGQGVLPTISLSVPNITREVQTLLDENSGLTRRKVWIRLVNSAFLTEADTIELGRFTIIQSTSNESATTFELGRVDLFDTEVPKRRFRRDSCGHVYKSDICGYAGDLPTCDKTRNGPNGCTFHGDDEVANGSPRLHPLRFGGAPGIPKQRN